MHRRHPHYRLGDPEVITGDFTTAPLAPRASGGGFLTPKTGNLLVGAGLLTALGVVGYYVYKGGSLTDLWDKLTAGEKRLSPGGHELPPERESRPVVAVRPSVFVSPIRPLPSGVASYIPSQLPSGRGGTGAGSVYRPAVDMY
jgi:hypothetical protein